MKSNRSEPEKWVRFRADPSKIRISLGKNGYGDWRVIIVERKTMKWISSTGLNPKAALDYALRHAEERGFDGIDRRMQCVYEHPYYNKE